MWMAHLLAKERQGKAVIACGCGSGSGNRVGGSMSTSGDVVPWVGAALWESRVGVAVVETRNMMVVVVQLPLTSRHVC